MNKGLAVSWTIGLGLLAGAIAGTIVPAETLSQEVRHVAGFSLVFSLALYVIFTVQWDYWQRTNPYVRFVVYLLSLLVSVVVLVQVAVIAFGMDGVLGRIAAFVAASIAFAIASWLTFYGGADRIWDELIARTDVDW